MTVETNSLTFKILNWSTLLLIIGAILVSVLNGPVNLDFGFMLDQLQKNLRRAWHVLLNQNKMNSYLFWLPLTGIILAERIMPVTKQQKLFTVGFFQDLMWFLSVPVFAVFLVYRFSSTFKNIFEIYNDFLSIDMLTVLPLPLQIIMAILVSDFLSWFTHLLKHKIKLLWYFHSVHHSQTTMSFLTDARVHPLDRIVSFMIRYIPMVVLVPRHGVSLGIAWWFFVTWHTRIYHASIRTNYGFLRYVLVTPQSHRIHHSSQSQHQDLNYGVIFSFWDRILGTHYENCDEYPDTGVADNGFPMERRLGAWSIVQTFVRQLIYPFRMIINRGL